MSGTINTSTIGRPPSNTQRKARRHVRSLTGDFPEIDERGEEKWPRGEEKAWKAAMRGVHTGVRAFLIIAMSDDRPSSHPPERHVDASSTPPCVNPVMKCN
jgi:hypothetical protein